MVDLQWKRNPSILSSSEKAVEIPENKAAVVPDINDLVAAGYDRKVYIGKLLKIDDSDAKISLYEHAGTLSIGLISREPKKRDEIWVDFVNILYVVPVPADTKREKKNWKVYARKCDGKIFCMEEYKVTLFLFLIVLDIQCDFLLIVK